MSFSKINLCLSCDDNYAKYAGVVVASVLANANADDNLKIYILDGGISDDKKEKILSLASIKNCEIIFVPIDESMFEDYAKVKTHKYISVATYYRLKAPSLLPNVDKIIYFDCDIVANSSLKELFEIDIKDYLLAGVSDNKKRIVKENPTYVNAGMLLMNLDKMRKENTEEEFYNYTKENINTITKGDQEIINEVCKGKIKVIDSQWNVQTSNFVNRSDYTVNPKIIHYLSKEKPWKFGSYSYHKNYWFKYLQLTPWALNAEEKKYWYNKNFIASILGYIKHRPLFFLRPRFYKALLLTYVFKNKQYANTKEICLFNFPIIKYQDAGKRYITKFLGIKFTINKNPYSKKQLAKLNKPYEIGENTNRPKVLNVHQTLELLATTNKSIARYGDGEFNLIFGESIPFQTFDSNLQNRLKDILVSCDENIMIGIPDVFGDLSRHKKDHIDFWRKYTVNYRQDIYNIIDMKKTYCDSIATRLYIEYLGYLNPKECFDKFKTIWTDKEIVFVEGEASRLGYKNDLFSGAKSIKRIICPAKDAFGKYNEILEECKKQTTEKLFIIALGPTATVLAYDLTKLGYRALDLGHIDIEYEWFLRGSKEKILIKDKYVNEVKGGRTITQLEDEEYLSQIIRKI